MDDKYQLHIILGEHIRGNEARITELKNDCEKSIDESNQKLTDYKDLKDRLAQEKENNDDLENDLKQKDEEINLLKMQSK